MKISIKLISFTLSCLIGFGMLTPLNYEVKCVDQTITRKKLLDDRPYKLLSVNSYDDLDMNLVNDYLINGGVIINDETVTSELLLNYYGVKTTIYDENIVHCVYYDGNSNKLLNVGVSFYKSINNVSLSEEILSDIYNQIILEKQKSSNIYSLNEVYNESISQILYEDDSTTKMCVYTIDVSVTELSKDNSSSLKGYYTVNSVVTVDLESGYCIDNYEVVFKFNSNIKITSENYNNHNSSFQTVTESNGTYSDTLTVQASSDEFGVESSISKNYDLYSLDDNITTSFSAKMNSLVIKDDAWWVFQKSYTMDSANARSVIMSWNYNGLL